MNQIATRTPIERYDGRYKPELFKPSTHEDLIRDMDGSAGGMYAAYCEKCGEQQWFILGEGMQTNYGYELCRCRRVEQGGEDIPRGAAESVIVPRNGSQSFAITAAKDLYYKIAKHEKGHGLYLYGNTGCGKTMIAKRLHHAVTSRLKRSVAFYDMQVLLLELTASVASGDWGQICKDALDDAKTKSLFVLDDVGAERMTEFSTTFFEGLIRTLEQSRVPILITSNYALTGGTPEQNLSGRCDQRVVSRICGMVKQCQIVIGDQRRADGGGGYWIPQD